MHSRIFEPYFKVIISPALLLPLILCLSVSGATAGSATWKAQPAPDRNWNTPANWTPNTVPNGPTDIATVGFSDKSPSIYGNIELDGIVFNPGASPLKIDVVPNYLASLTFVGTGVTNNAGIIEAFSVFTDGSYGTITFMNSATAGTQTSFLCYAGLISDGSLIQFLNTSSAGSASFTYLHGDSSHLAPSTRFFDSSTAGQGTFMVTGGGNGANVFFYDNSTAGNGVFTAAGAVSGWGTRGGNVFLYDSATAGSGVFTAEGTTYNGGFGGVVTLFGSSTADQGVFIANPAAIGTEGGVVSFQEGSDGGTARVEVFGNGRFDISGHDSPGVTIGSLEGDGLATLGANNLTSGSNNLSTTFSGTIGDGDVSPDGSLTKIGTGNLTLTGANTYTGGTIVTGGILLANNTNGSGTGSGPVQVTAGTFGGGGKVSGAVSVGTGSGPGAFLGPGATGVVPGTLTIRKKLTLMADATYKVTTNSSSVTADKVSAKGVKIRGAQILLDDRATSVLATGTAFTVINNTAATPISGTFANLADGSTVIVGNNTFQADYEGGDGNDLTLTVVP